MTQNVLSFSMAAIMGIGVAIMMRIQNERESEGETVREGSSRYPAFVSPYLLPVYMILMLALRVLPESRYELFSRFALSMFRLFVHISIYHMILLLVIPLLRERISARVCAVLWVLPSLMYFFDSTGTNRIQPLWVIPLPAIPLPAISSNWLFFIWLGGFAVVMCWKAVAHLKFRRMLLTSAEPVMDPGVLRLWEEEQTAFQVKQGYKKDPKPIPLVRSERITTPLTIGLLKNSVCMVLPEKYYTEEEYRLIFRHELTHIGREDNGNKFFLTFCTAMCWFNPLMWIAMRQCAADLERSCDETVLLNADMETKKQYAFLLLKTAGDDRGYTTCLSASGESMRYRLKSAMDTSKRHVGSIVAGICAFVMCVSYGLIGCSTVSYAPMTAKEAIYQENGIYKLWAVESDRKTYRLLDDRQVEDALHQYFSEQQVSRSTRDYGVGRDRIRLHYENPDIRVNLFDEMLEIVYGSGPNSERKYYDYEEPMDWEYLYHLLEMNE